MKNKSNVPRPRKPSTFDRYVAERSAHIEKNIEHTLRVVDATKYSNLTDYCRAVANVVSEIRAAKAGDPNSPFYNKAAPLQLCDAAAQRKLQTSCGGDV